MANLPAQSFSSHTKWSPPFHFFLTPILLLNLLYRGRILMRELSFDALWSVVVASALLVAAFLIRIYSLKVQDRLIRLEERLRMKELLAPALYQRALQLTEAQLVALRFASDGELAERVSEALDQNLQPKQIKERVKTWRPDHFRV